MHSRTMGKHLVQARSAREAGRGSFRPEAGLLLPPPPAEAEAGRPFTGGGERGGEVRGGGVGAAGDRTGGVGVLRRPSPFIPAAREGWLLARVAGPSDESSKLFY